MKTLIVNSEDHVLHVKLNRPEVHNAFNPEMIDELIQVFSDTENIKSYKLVTLSGEGKSFSAGADINWMQSMADYTFEENFEDAEKLFMMFDCMKNCPAPIIGKVHGNVFGGGLGLVAVCDIVVCVEGTKFSFSEPRLGLVPSVISPFIKRKAQPHLMREVMLTAEIFDTDKALRMGLLHYVGSEEQMDQEIVRISKFIKKCGTKSIRSTKKLLNSLEHWDWKQTKKETAELIAKRRVSEEGQEGLRAFLEKRKQ